MAGRNYTPVMFGLEKNIVSLFCRVVFNPSGVAVLDTNNSKGICAFNLETVSFTGATTNSSSSVGTVSSFVGLYTGMTVTGAAGSIQSGTTIGTISAATDSLVLSKQAILTNAANPLVASGGRYRVQFGSLAGVNLDAYNRILSMSVMPFETTSSSSGGVSVAQFAPGVDKVFVVNNQVSIRTIPSTAASVSTDCSLALQMGTGVGTNFVVQTPAAGESYYFHFLLSNSTAV